MYTHRDIESKWQKYWQEKKIFKAIDNSSKPKFYGLVEFPYPSGDGLHTGHLRSYTAMDIIARHKKMQGHEVLYPIGMDAFGLPTENYAIKKKIAPQKVSQQNIANFKRQLYETGYAFDWSRYLETTDPEYYRWTQWIFIKLWEKGLAYKAKETINWCPSCKIGLANEEVVGGACERCGNIVIKKEKEQWLLKITKYADRLLDGLDKIDFLERIKSQQKNWIGKSQGAEIKFKVKNQKSKVFEELTVFTTRPDTIFGVTFMVVSPELCKKWLGLGWAASKEAQDYINKALVKSELDRQDQTHDKTGVDTGIRAIHPLTKEELPVWVADYVLAGYGTGAIMAVPAHDERDFAFAKKFNLKIKCVVKPMIAEDIQDKESEDNAKLRREKKRQRIENGEECYTQNGDLMNSGEFNDKGWYDGGKAITQRLVRLNLGKPAINYRLRDWIFSRQRYWGEPIPMINCPKCGWQAVPEKDLPVVLPEIEDFMPTDSGDSPLAKIDFWVKAKCPKCGGEARRETDVMPNWAGSNWYFIRYTDPENKKQLVDGKKAKYWLPVDWYNGGMEHTTLHLLYSRFIFKFLYDIGAVPKSVGDEPYKKRTAQGMILGEGNVKMSKSKGNVVNPDKYIEKFGADATRLYIMFMGPFDQDVAWDDQSILGVSRFINKVFNLKDKIADHEDTASLKLLHATIKKVTEDIETMSFNTAISQMMILANYLDKQAKIDKNILQKFAYVLAPFAPHTAEELNQILGGKASVFLQSWPGFDQKLVLADRVTLAIQVDGKVRDQLELPQDTEPSQELEADILKRDRVQKAIAGREIKKFIHIKNKIISIVTK